MPVTKDLIYKFPDLRGQVINDVQCLIISG